MIFKLSLQVNQGENNMVNLVENWDVLEKYAEDKQGCYQLLGSDESCEVRVVTGSLGFKRDFSNPADKLLTRILEFCKSHGYIRIIKTVRDEAFFR